jgi:hypothetical protein
MKHRSQRIALTATVLGVLLLPLSAGPAAAAPTDCWTNDGVWFPYATAYCSGGTGAYEAWATCMQNFWPYNAAFVVTRHLSKATGNRRGATRRRGCGALPVIGC